LSGYIEHASHWDGSRAHFVKNVEEFGAMLTLDAVLFNDDRHRKNILLTPMPTEDNLKVRAIDVGNARIGYPSDFAELGLNVPVRPNIARGLPLKFLWEGAMAAAQKAEKLAGTQVLDGYVREACELVREPTAALVSRALTERMAHAGALVEKYVKVLEAIS
jgi:hypothetical protein